MNIAHDFLTNHNRPRSQIKPTYIVIHWTANEGRGANAQANRNYFQNTDRFCSAHYLVDSVGIVQAVPEDEMAYHVGANAYRHLEARNHNSIGIEMCVNVDGDFKRMEANTIALVTELCMRWDINVDTHVIRHYDVTGKDCPRFYVQDKTAWGRFKQRVKDGMIGGHVEMEKTIANEIIQYLKDAYGDATEAGKKARIGFLADQLRMVSGQAKQN